MTGLYERSYSVILHQLLEIQRLIFQNWFAQETTENILFLQSKLVGDH